VTEQEGASGCPFGELAVGWALHALELAEEALVAAHLADCPACTHIVTDTEHVGAALGLSLPEMTPSPALDQRILAITKTRDTAPVTSLVQPKRRNKQMMRPAGRMLAAAAVVVILAAASVTLGIRVVQLDSQRDQAARQVTAISEAIQRVADPASIRVPLRTEDGRSMATVLASRTDVALVTTALPRNRTEDQIYVLWGIDDGTPRALTGFDVAPDGPVLYDVPSVAGDAQFTGYAVSLEPGRSTPAKPTTVMAMGMVTS
jgi:hypothetical protein